MEYDELRAMEKTHICAQCGGEPVTVHDFDNDCWRLACGNDKTHNGFKRRQSVTTALKRGEADEAIQPGAQKDLEDRAKRSETALSLLPAQDIATKRALGIVEIEGLILFANTLGLSAYLGHVCLYHGKPYIGIDGYYYLNNKRHHPYRIAARPMSKEEKITYMIEKATHAYIAEAWLDGERVATHGIGYVTTSEINEKSERNPEHFRAPVVHNHPQRMAEKRAEWQLLRKLIPLEFKE